MQLPQDLAEVAFWVISASLKSIGVRIFLYIGHSLGAYAVGDCSDRLFSEQNQRSPAPLYMCLDCLSQSALLGLFASGRLAEESDDDR